MQRLSLSGGFCAAAAVGMPLSGCIQGPNYSKPVVDVPVQYRIRPPAGATQSPSATAAWWRGMSDPQLDALVREALAKNTDLKVATARVD
jgi:multidrug efflux system outer membrane protein